MCLYFCQIRLRYIRDFYNSQQENSLSPSLSCLANCGLGLLVISIHPSPITGCPKLKKRLVVAVKLINKLPPSVR